MTVAVDNNITEEQRLDHLVQSTTCKTDTSEILQLEGVATFIDLYTKAPEFTLTNKRSTKYRAYLMENVFENVIRYI